MTIIILLSVLIIYNNQSWEKDIFIPLIELQVVENWYLFINISLKKKIYLMKPEESAGIKQDLIFL